MGRPLILRGRPLTEVRGKGRAVGRGRPLIWMSSPGTEFVF